MGEKGVKISSLQGPGGGTRNVVIVEPWVLRQLAERAITDVEHYLRPTHLAQLAKIMDDPEASDNDRFTAHNLLQNATIAARACCQAVRTPARPSFWARRASSYGLTKRMRSISLMGYTTPTRNGIFGTRRCP